MQNYDYLQHFNPYHDPKNGQFTSGGSGTGRSSQRKKKYRSEKELERVYKNRESDDPKEIDNWVKMWEEIKDKSVDTYNDEPKSDRQRKVKEEREKAVAENPEYKKALANLKVASEAYENYMHNRSKMYEWFNLHNAKEDKLWRDKVKANSEAMKLERSIRDTFAGKTASAVLKDLGFKDTEQARIYLRDSGVLWWD